MCECQNQSKDFDGSASASEQARTVFRSHAAMCEVCRYADRGTDAHGVRTAVWCRKAKIPVYAAITISRCPVGRFEAYRTNEHETPIYKWAFIRWYGVPMPIRIYHRLFTAAHPSTKAYEGCGCIKALKDIYGQVKQRWSLIWA